MANRKLQGEIERVLKKVDEGVQVFEQIWDKVYSATTAAQKEKYEGDLKKEIKKLQRLRDNIKTWQGDSSIKDKSRLDANRKLIEEKMEKFKICEKETKTKAFSKEGLAQDRTDPKQKAKAGVGDWVREAIAKLNEQSEELEAEIETLNSGKRKKRGEENPRVSQLKEHISRHEYHVEMLERVLRAVDNDAVSPEEASELKESVDCYIDDNQDPDFFEDDEMYDALNLDAPIVQPLVSKKVGKNSDREREEEEETNPSSSTPNLLGSSKRVSVSPRSTKGTKSLPASTPNSKSASMSTGVVGRNISPRANRNEKSPVNVSPTSPRNGINPNIARDTNITRNPNTPLLSSVVKGSASTKVTPTGVSQPNVTAEGQDVHAVVNKKPMQETTSPPSTGSVSSSTDGNILPTSSTNVTMQENQELLIPAVNKPISAISPMKETPAQIQPQKLSEIDRRLASLDCSLGFMPETTGNNQNGQSQQNGEERSNETNNGTSSLSHNPVDVPSCFPNVPTPVFESRQVFERFDPDTLFFIFYYQQGTYQQYLAATELKRQGWRFHKKYLTWFQRHEPKASTPKYETGTFIYFDYANVVVRGQGTGWCQRIKSEFVFEYRFLEDDLRAEESV